jgi:hypothetical protein
MPVIAATVPTPVVMTLLLLISSVLSRGAGVVTAEPGVPDTTTLTLAATAARVFIIVVPAATTAAQVSRRLTAIGGQPLTINDT